MVKYAPVAVGPHNLPARILGGVIPSLPIYQRVKTEDEVKINGTVYPSYCYGHEYGKFHQAHRTRMPQLSWAIYRLRRARAGQLSLIEFKRTRQ